MYSWVRYGALVYGRAGSLHGFGPIFRGFFPDKPHGNPLATSGLTALSAQEVDGHGEL